MPPPLRDAEGVSTATTAPSDDDLLRRCPARPVADGPGRSSRSPEEPLARSEESPGQPYPAAVTHDQHAPSGRPRRRWGLWALAFLAVALAVVLTSGEGYTSVSALVLLVSLTAAGYCSYRGVKDFTWLPR